VRGSARALVDKAERSAAATGGNAISEEGAIVDFGDEVKTPANIVEIER
jgi:hypothetical protein